MNKKQIIVLAIVAASFFGLGALSDSAILNITWELQRRAGYDRVYSAICDGTGDQTSNGYWYFRGRAEANEQALDLVNRTNSTGSIIDITP